MCVRYENNIHTQKKRKPYRNVGQRNHRRRRRRRRRHRCCQSATTTTTNKNKLQTTLTHASSHAHTHTNTHALTHMCELFAQFDQRFRIQSLCCDRFVIVFVCAIIAGQPAGRPGCPERWETPVTILSVGTVGFGRYFYLRPAPSKQTVVRESGLYSEFIRTVCGRRRHRRRRVMRPSSLASSSSQRARAPAKWWSTWAAVRFSLRALYKYVHIYVVHTHDARREERC